MLERFRSWEPKGKIKVSFRDENGSKSIWEADVRDISSKIVSITEEYISKGMTLTNRQLYYQLVARGYIPNATEIYKRICKLLTDLRYSAYVDWSSIEDRGRVPTRHSQWSSVNSLINSAVASYRLPRWKGQEYYVELYCEKQAMESVFKPISDKYHIYFGSNKGYSSASTMYDLAQRVKQQLINGKKVVILYFGDHDASGLDMIRDIRDRVTEFLTNGDVYVDAENFEVKQIALNIEQVKLYNPPPNPAKQTDPRAKWYINKFGERSWELDSLKPEILIQLSEEAILNHIDIDKYNNIVAQEKREIKSLEEFGRKLNKDDGDGDDDIPNKLVDAKTFVLSKVDHSYEYDEDTAKDSGLMVGDTDYFCPICDDHYVTLELKYSEKNIVMDELWEHILEKHDQIDYEQWLNRFKGDED